MHMFKHKCDLCGIETSLWWTELTNGSKICKELSSLDELEHDIKVLWVLAYSVSSDVEIKVEWVENEDFVFQVIYLLTLNDLVFFKLFKDIILLRPDILDKLDSSKRTFSQYSKYFVLWKLYFRWVFEL